MCNRCDRAVRRRRAPRHRVTAQWLVATRLHETGWRWPRSTPHLRAVGSLRDSRGSDPAQGAQVPFRGEEHLAEPLEQPGLAAGVRLELGELPDELLCFLLSRRGMVSLRWCKGRPCRSPLSPGAPRPARRTTSPGWEPAGICTSSGSRRARAPAPCAERREGVADRQQAVQVRWPAARSARRLHVQEDVQVARRGNRPRPGHPRPGLRIRTPSSTPAGIRRVTLALLGHPTLAAAGAAALLHTRPCPGSRDRWW